MCAQRQITVSAHRETIMVAHTHQVDSGSCTTSIPLAPVRGNPLMFTRLSEYAYSPIFGGVNCATGVLLRNSHTLVIQPRERAKLRTDVFLSPPRDFFIKLTPGPDMKKEDRQHLIIRSRCYMDSTFNKCASLYLQNVGESAIVIPRGLLAVRAICQANILPARIVEIPNYTDPHSDLTSIDWACNMTPGMTSVLARMQGQVDVE